MPQPRRYIHNQWLQNLSVQSRAQSFKTTVIVHQYKSKFNNPGSYRPPMINNQNFQKITTNPFQNQNHNITNHNLQFQPPVSTIPTTKILQPWKKVNQTKKPQTNLNTNSNHNNNNNNNSNNSNNYCEMQTQISTKNTTNAKTEYV